MQRLTRQRSSIRAALTEAGRPLSPAEVLVSAQREVSALSMATVYRNLKQLVDAGEVQPVELPGDAPRYELAGHAHHHHFVCDSCQRAYVVPGCSGDMAKLAPPGFEVARHELTLYGTCADCATSRPSGAATPQKHA